MIGGAYLLAALLIFALYFPGPRSNRVVAE